jgi:hypothetical protein
VKPLLGLSREARVTKRELLAWPAMVAVRKFSLFFVSFVVRSSYFECLTVPLECIALARIR